MKKFTSEFCIKGSYGYQVATSNTIEGLIAIMENRGFEFYQRDLSKLKEWEIISKDGDKIYGNCFTIRNGEARMTDYTSL